MNLFAEPTKYTKQYFPNKTTNRSCYMEEGVHYETTRCKTVNLFDISLVFDIEKKFKNHQKLADMLQKEFADEIDKKIIKVTNTAGLVNHRFVFCTVPMGTKQDIIADRLLAIENKYNDRIDYCISMCK